MYECGSTSEQFGAIAAACRKHAAYAMAGLAPADIDVAELYDCFTSVVLETLEDYGFCEKGERGPFVENGHIELDGELPVNTSGGLLSQANASGFFHITEAATQLRGVTACLILANHEALMGGVS